MTAIDVKNTQYDDARIAPALWWIFAFALAGNIFGGAISTLMAVYLPEVLGDLVGKMESDRVDKIGALINSWYLFGWTLGGFLWGWVSDRVGRMKSFLISFFLYGLFSLSISFLSSWEVIVALRFFTGFCVGGVLVITNTLLSEVWPQKSRAIFIGFLSIGFPIGIVSAGMINYLFHNWRTGFLIGLVPATLAIIAFLITSKATGRAELNLVPARRYRMKEVFNDNHENLIKGSVIFGSMLIGMWAVFSWLPTWMQSILGDHDGQQQRSLCMMLLGIGGLTGGFSSGWIARGVGLNNAMKLSFAGCLVLALVIFGLNRSFTPIIYLEIAILAFFFGISQGILSTYVPQLFETYLRGTATGFCYNIGRVFTTMAVFFVGALVSYFGGYGNTLMIFSAVFLAGLIATYYSKDLTLKT